MKTKTIPITPYALLTLFQRDEQHFRILNPLPDDIEIVKTEYDQNHDQIIITIKSNEFTTDSIKYMPIFQEI